MAVDDAWWHERYDKLLDPEGEVLDAFDPLTYTDGRLSRVIETCRVSALGRDTEHPDLGMRSELGKRIRARYFLVLQGYRSHNERYERGWVIPDWRRSDDVEGVADRAVRKWSAERWAEEDVEPVRTALRTVMSLLDGVGGDLAKPQRKLLNRTLFLIGSEASAMYNILTRISRATRADKKAWRESE